MRKNFLKKKCVYLSETNRLSSEIGFCFLDFHQLNQSLIRRNVHRKKFIKKFPEATEIFKSEMR